MKKIWSIVFSLTLLFFSPYGQSDELPVTPNVQLYPECNLPSASLPVCHFAEPYFNAEFLYWFVKEDNLEFATSNLSVSGTSPDIVDGKVYRPDWKMRPGFKAGAGLNFYHDQWDLYSQYTWLRTKEIKGKAAPNLEKGFLVADLLWTLNGIENPGQYHSATEVWELDFNVIDLELGRSFYISERLSLRPHFGLKGTWQRQSCDVAFTIQTFEGADPSSFPGTNTITDTMAARETYWGIGPRIGLELNWYLFDLFSILGEFATSGIWEHFNVSRFDQESNITLDPGSSNPLIEEIFSLVHQKNKINTLKPVIECFLGIRFGGSFAQDTYRLLLDVGYEQQFWFSQNQFFTFTVESKSGDLSLGGLTTALRFDF